MTAESVGRSGGDANVIRGCLFLLVVWCRLACIVEMVVAAQQQLSQYYIVLLVVPFFFYGHFSMVWVSAATGPASIYSYYEKRKKERSNDII